MRDYRVCHCVQCQAKKNPKKKRVMRRRVRARGKSALWRFMIFEVYADYRIYDWTPERIDAPCWDLDWK